jgi:hypothetical protein
VCVVNIAILEELVPVAAATPVHHHLPVDLVCSSCGYGVAAPHVPGSCPMCRNDVWEPAAWQPFAARLELVELELDEA